MNLKTIIALLFAALSSSIVSGQSETYIVNKSFFSTDKYDEFSPVGYRNGIVFCSNSVNARLFNYTTEQNKGLIKINFIDTLNTEQVPRARLFSKSITTNFNDGPVTFSSDGDTIYFSRNILVAGKSSELSSARNKLGIFYSVYDGEGWNKIRELRINNEYYNVTTPWLSPDGKRLYFASDKPGGHGGSDLYYSQWKNDYWDDPVNLGPVINTRGNESYPFMNAAGEFYFASDGHPGLGGKDIFFSRMTDSTWIKPVCLDAPVNSQYDDFGIFTDALMSKGYFSSNRDKSVDIFEFTTSYPQIFYDEVQKENDYCFRFSDNRSIPVDSTHLQYRWLFGDGTSATGSVTSHCFPGPGNYTVRLDIIEKETGRLFFTKLIQNFQILDYEQPFIDCPLYAVKGQKISFNGSKSNLPGYQILSYSWDFGDRNRQKGEKVDHIFREKGEYAVNLEIAMKSESTGLIRKAGVSRKILILNNDQESARAAGYDKSEKIFGDISNSKNVTVQTQYSAETDFQKDGVFCIELLQSVTKADVNGITRKLPDNVYLRERIDPLGNGFSYTVDQFLNLMSAFPAYRRMMASGFTEAKVKMFVLTDPAEKEIVNLMRVNGSFAESYFDYTEKLTSNALIMLDQLVKFLNRYPTVKLEVAVHTDNIGSPEITGTISQKRAQIMVDYLVNRGVNARRLVARGYGGSKPVAGNIFEKDRKLNRRIEFTIISR